jgi:hypothetical protein
MKYIKKFENIKNAKIDDYVICIDNWGATNDLNKGYTYQIKDISSSNITHNIAFKFDDTNPKSSWNSNRFRLATPEEIDEYQMKKSTKKYNL